MIYIQNIMINIYIKYGSVFIINLSYLLILLYFIYFKIDTIFQLLFSLLKDKNVLSLYT